MIDAGYEDRILIGQDIHTSHRLERYGGHGFGHMLRMVKNQHGIAGISPSQWEKLGLQNPQKFFQINISWSRGKRELKISAFKNSSLI